jgi:hypothetical protein
MAAVWARALSGFLLTAPCSLSQACLRLPAMPQPPPCPCPNLPLPPMLLSSLPLLQEMWRYPVWGPGVQDHYHPKPGLVRCNK